MLPNLSIDFSVDSNSRSSFISADSILVYLLFIKQPPTHGQACDAQLTKLEILLYLSLCYNSIYFTDFHAFHIQRYSISCGVTSDGHSGNISHTSCSLSLLLPVEYDILYWLLVTGSQICIVNFPWMYIKYLLGILIGILKKFQAPFCKV